MGRIKTIKRIATNILELSEEWARNKRLKTNQYKHNGKMKANKKHLINIKWPGNTNNLTRREEQTMETNNLQTPPLSLLQTEVTNECDVTAWNSGPNTKNI